MSKGQHIVPQGDNWAVKGEKNQRATVVVPTQKEAIERGREIAQNQSSELHIHGKDGKIRERRSYGNDPCPPRDRK